MLSYRHSFHAGNFADVIKHIVVVEILEHLIKKDKAFDYIDTHAGAGLYDLHSVQAGKLAEHISGVGKLKSKEWPELARYFQAIAALNKSPELNFYPGSPLLASQFLRAQDKAWLYELHPRDYALLQANLANDRRVKTFCQDGLKGLLSKVPPVSRRGFVLIDPSYEVKKEYEDVFAAVRLAYQKFATGIYAVWYPVVDRAKINKLEKSFISSGMKNIQQFELGVSPDTEARGMTGAGMIVINPPWGLHSKMQQVLPKLVAALASEDGGFFKCEILVEE